MAVLWKGLCVPWVSNNRKKVTRGVGWGRGKKKPSQDRSPCWQDQEKNYSRYNHSQAVGFSWLNTNDSEVTGVMYLQVEKVQKWPDPPFYSIWDPFPASPGIKIITQDLKAFNMFLLNSPHHQRHAYLFQGISILLPFKCNHCNGLFYLVVFLQFCIPFPSSHYVIILPCWNSLEFSKTYLIIFQMLDFICFKFMKCQLFCINPCLHLGLQLTFGQCGDSGLWTRCSWKSMCNFWLYRSSFTSAVSTKFVSGPKAVFPVCGWDPVVGSTKTLFLILGWLNLPMWN